MKSRPRPATRLAEDVRNRSAGKWREIESSPHPLACMVCGESDVFVGTDDSALLKLNRKSELVLLDGFMHVAGRKIGTLARQSSMVKRSALLVNIHVGGIARSVDQGTSWSPNNDINYDVHEVTAHPNRPREVIAAAGLCVSRDGGETWGVDAAGLHATYCSAADDCCTRGALRSGDPR
jgi:hypothetical protein